MIADEPVRGRMPPPWFWALSGIDRIQALADGSVARPPLLRLLALKPGHVSPGVCTWTMPATEWLPVGHGTVDVSALAEMTLLSAAMTTLPAGRTVRAVTLALHHFRPSRVQSGGYVARARVLTASRFFVSASVEIEDPQGRAITHADGHYKIVTVEPAPPAPPAELVRVEEPAYDLPDPSLRPMPRAAGSSPSDEPFWRFLGARVGPHADGGFECVVPTSEWHCHLDPAVSPGIIAAIVNSLGSTAGCTMIDADQTFAGLEQGVHVYRPLAADGRALRALMHPSYSEGGMRVADVDLHDADEILVARGRSLGVAILATERRARPAPRSRRILATLLFSDVVGSTEHLARLGDAGWAALRDRHHAAVRATIAEHDGVEVDTAGDGFLVRFESPAQALDYAAKVRAVVGRLDLQVRIGVHTGECELQGRAVTGMAVHVAARLQAVARPGEILVSEIVTGLAMGSVHTFEDRGAHELKGVPGTWRLFVLVVG